MNDKPIFIRWYSGDATARGVRLVRVRKGEQWTWWGWKDIDRGFCQGLYRNDAVFEDKGEAIADGERRRKERLASLQKQIDKLSKPMRVVEKLKGEPE